MLRSLREPVSSELQGRGKGKGKGNERREWFWEAGFMAGLRLWHFASFCCGISCGGGY